jgi:hypothetical protein
VSVARARKEAAKRLGLALHREYRDLVEAAGTDDIQAAAIILGDTFNSNIEFIINVLKAFGGMDVKFEPLTRPKAGIIDAAAPAIAANDLPPVPELFRAGCDVDLIGRKH